MNNSIITSSVSMHGLQQKLDILANNMANSNTVGFKKKEASFEDVLTNIKNQPQGFRQQGRLSPLGFNQGWGSRLVQAQTNMTQGPIQSTNKPTDLAIQGDGLFEVALPTIDPATGQPQRAWTRNGEFSLSPDAQGTMTLTTSNGYFLVDTQGDPIRIPKGARLSIDQNGQYTAINEMDPTAPPTTGQIQLVRVIRPQELQNVGDNLYSLPTGVANPQNILQNVNGNVGVVNAADRVEVRQGFLEQSNVNMSDEMTELIMIQKAFQLNSRAITSSDTMMNLANNLRA
jgi:flagellar basal-body rod protein FlgG